MGNDLIQSGGGPEPWSNDSGGGFAEGTGRRAQIERIMATDRDRYFRDGLDQELAELRAFQESHDDDDAGVHPLAVARSMQAFQSTQEGSELAAAWRNTPGGFETALATVQRDVGGLVRELGNHRIQRIFMEKFDRHVTERARYHIYDEIRSGSLSYAPPASPPDVAAFGDCEPGAELVREWGSDAPARVGRVLTRTRRFRERLDDASDYASFTEWYDSLHPSAVKTILRFLAG